MKPGRSELTSFRQLIEQIPGHLTKKLAKKHGVDVQARTFSPWSHVVSLCYAQFDQFRLLLNAVAYQIMHSFRENILKGTQWAKSTFKTIQLKILKVSARLEVKKTFIRVHMPKSCITKQIYQRFAHINQHLKKT